MEAMIVKFLYRVRENAQVLAYHRLNMSQAAVRVVRPLLGNVVHEDAHSYQRTAKAPFVRFVRMLSCGSLPCLAV
jgi:hypothetical protein